MKLVAFLGRYGHQQYESVKHLSMRQLVLLAQSLNELLREENDAMRSRMETDGV